MMNTEFWHLISWIIIPRTQVNYNGIVELRATKVTKILKILQIVASLLRNAKASLNKALLSLTIHGKTDTNNVADSLHKLVYETSYIETVFCCW